MSEKSIIEEITRKVGHQKARYYRWSTGFGVAILTGFAVAIWSDQLLVGIKLVLPIITLWFALIDPYLKRPKLEMVVESRPRCSGNDDPSWFARIAVANTGLLTAKNCKGKLLGVWNSTGEKIYKFDPLDLFWTRQDGTEQNPFSPIDLHGGGDFNFLDIVQVKEGNSPVGVRVNIPKGMKLEAQPENSDSPGSDPNLNAGEYFFKVAIYSESASDLDSPQFLKLTCVTKIPDSCEKKEVDPVELKPSSKQELEQRLIPRKN